MSLEVAEALARRGRNVEIVSCDSMAVYRRLDVVADKPSSADRSVVRHHLIDVVDPDVEFTVVEYQRLARAAIGDIASRDSLPMLVGGSGLYFRAVVDDLGFAPTSPVLRKRLEIEDPAELFNRLREVDPATAERLDPRNKRRVVRALEVHELTGRPPSELRGDWERRGERYRLTAVGLTWDRADLYRRLEERVRRQFDSGLVDEVHGVGELSKTSRQALGVKEVAAVAQGTTIEEACELLVRNGKAFARRQLSWFCADERIEWFNVSEIEWEAAVERIAERFAEALGA